MTDVMDAYVQFLLHDDISLPGLPSFLPNYIRGGGRGMLGKEVRNDLEHASVGR